MAGKNNLIKSFFNDKGLDLRSSDLVRGPEHASELMNADYRKTGALNKRKGYQSKEESKGGAGAGIYANVNVTTGAIAEELVVVDANLHKLTDETFTVSYSGSNVATMNLFLDTTTSTFKFQLTDGGTQVLNFDLGTGIDVASPITGANLKTQIDAVTDFTATISGSTAVPAAFFNIQRDVTVASGGTIIKFVAFVTINAPVASPLATAQTNKNDAEFQNASLVNLQNVLYVGTGYDHLHKYDGQTFYRAGMPAATKATTVNAAAGVITNSDTKYLITLIQKDNKGNIVEGVESAASVGLNLTTRQVDVTVTNIINTTGFNTNCGIVAGAQSTINTITVDDGSSGSHTIKQGDTAFFFDSVSGDYIERNVTSVASTTITVAGAAVTVADNAVISNNLKIAIYRNKSAGSTFSLVVEVPNDSFTATQVFRDNVTDANLGGDFIVPIKQHGLPPKGKYLTVFRNQLIIGGDLTNVNTTYYSDVDGSEFFPAGDNSFLVETNFGDKITGLSTNNNALFIFKEKSIHSLTGDIAADQFRVDIVSGGDVGCVSHHTIAEVKGKLMFLGTKGVFGLTIGDNEAEEISFNIEPIFRDVNSDFILTKAVAVNWFQKDKYILFLPSESDSSGNKYTNLTLSRMLVFDYSRSAWLEWDNIDFQGGALILNDNLFFSERRLGIVSGNVESNIYQLQDTGDTFDYADHSTAITFEYKTHWEALGEPDVFKKFLRLKVQSLDASINDFESDSFKISVETQVNYIDSQSSSFDLDFSSEFGWGEFSWGVDAWGSSRGIQEKSKLKSVRVQSMRIIYSNETTHENILISGWTLEVNLPYRTRIKE